MGTISNEKQEPEACYPITKTTRQKRKQSDTDPFHIVEEENLDDSDILEDIDELSRLMSVVEIDDDPKEFEKQLNLAGNHRPFIYLWKTYLIDFSIPPLPYLPSPINSSSCQGTPYRAVQGLS